MGTTPTPTTLYGFSDVDVSKQIIFGDDVLAGISRAGQTISIYHGETLVADCTMPATGIADSPTVVVGEPTLHDETFTGFVDGETYTIVAGDEPPITGFAKFGLLWSFDFSTLRCGISDGNRFIARDNTNTHTNYSISQKITTTKKRYDIKRLPEELLPKTVATKAEVREAQSTADAAHAKLDDTWDFADSAWEKAAAAQSTADAAKTTADAAKTTADAASTKASSAKSAADNAYSRATNALNAATEAQAKVQTAQTKADAAKSAADSVAASAVKTADGYSYIVDSRSADHPYPEISLRDYSQIRYATVRLDESVGLVLTIARDGGISDINTTRNPATIKMNNMGGSGGVIVDGLRSLIMTSSTPNSTKQFKLTVDDSGVISATEVEG